MPTQQRPITSIDWAALVDGAIDGRAAVFRGVRLGDPAWRIPFDDATGVESSPPQEENKRRGMSSTTRYVDDASAPGGRRAVSVQRFFDVDDDGNETDVPREAIVAEIVEHGRGRAYFGSACVAIDGGVVATIWLRGAEALAGCPLRAKSDIVKAFGVPVGVERTLGWSVHHYPDRALAVGWHERENRLEHVGFDTTWQPRRFTRADVYAAWLAAPGTRPTDNDASAFALRQKQTRALLLAFDLGTPAEFENGAFLARRPSKVLDDAMKAHIARYDRKSARAPRPHDAPMCFRWLLQWRREAQGLLSLNSGWLEAGSAGIQTALAVTGRAARDVAAALADIDRLILDTICADAAKSFSEQELFDLGYPDVDIREIELDEL